jgi:hypothetical protein
MISSSPANELANVYARVEQLEKWSADAWAACRVTPR